MDKMLEKSSICSSNSVNLQKDVKNIIKTQNLMGLYLQKDYTYFLKFQDNEFILTIISHNREKGVNQE